MNHRLFHTLVLSGAALVEGCATASAPAAELSPAAESSPASARSTPSQSAPDAAPAAPSSQSANPPVAAGQPDPGDPALEAMIADVRACNEVGWPTTKSASMYYRSVMRAGRQYFCANDQSQARFRDLPRCCELVTR